jgi:hypothetical protein
VTNKDVIKEVVAQPDKTGARRGNNGHLFLVKLLIVTVAVTMLFAIGRGTLAYFSAFLEGTLNKFKLSDTVLFPPEPAAKGITIASGFPRGSRIAENVVEFTVTLSEGGTDNVSLLFENTNEQDVYLKVTIDVEEGNQPNMEPLKNITELNELGFSLYFENQRDAASSYKGDWIRLTGNTLVYKHLIKAGNSSTALLVKDKGAEVVNFPESVPLNSTLDFRIGIDAIYTDGTDKKIAQWIGGGILGGYSLKVDPSGDLVRIIRTDGE